jgi:hypothetical protein
MNNPKTWLKIMEKRMGRGGKVGKGRETSESPSLTSQLSKSPSQSSSQVASRVAMAKEVKCVVISKRTGKLIRAYRKHKMSAKPEVQSA